MGPRVRDRDAGSPGDGERRPPAEAASFSDHVDTGEVGAADAAGYTVLYPHGGACVTAVAGGGTMVLPTVGGMIMDLR
jgi:hypothetical protein